MILMLETLQSLEDALLGFRLAVVISDRLVPRSNRDPSWPGKATTRMRRSGSGTKVTSPTTRPTRSRLGLEAAPAWVTIAA